jgi:oligopeptide transport system substrate-binding protein
MTHSIRRLMLCLASTLLGLKFACAAAANLPTLQRGNGPEPDSLDPQRAQGLSAQIILRDLYEGLTRYNAHGEVEPAIAQSWTLSADQRVWRFRLDPKARFSDGSPIQAEDVRYSLTRALTPKTAAPYVAQLLSIRCARAMLNGQTAAASAPCPLGVRVLSAHELEIELAQANPLLPHILSLPIAAVLSRRCWETHGDACTRPGKLISSGPYQIRAWQPLAYVEIERNPHYRSPWPSCAFTRIKFHVTEDASSEARRFDASELHLTETIPPGRLSALRAKYGEALRIAPSLGSFFLGINHEHPALRDLRVRRALSLALHRQRIVELITGNGEPAAFGLLPAALRAGAEPDPHTRNLLHTARTELVRELYHAAGFSADKPLELELRYNTSVLNRRLMLAIAVMWEEALGVRTRLRNEEWKVFVQARRSARATQLVRGGWNADLADPLNFLQLYASGSELNYSRYRNTEFDALLAKAEAAPDRQQRIQIASAAEALLVRDQALIPLFYYTSKHLVHADLAGFISNPLDVHPSLELSYRACLQKPTAQALSGAP